MKFIFSIAILIISGTLQISSQKYMTRTGSISFFSEAPLENIEAYNNQVSGIIDMETGEMAFTLLMKAFSFEKALMQEHFNEKYVESHKYPKAKFSGKIENFSELELTANPQEVTVSGDLTIHGVTNPVTATGTLKKNADGKIVGKSVFMINIQDYDIKVPATVRKNIADNIEITVNMTYEEM